tara:strand:- start:3604 stop:5580 length:1977 start_codon:yes stop_codon:yes gene_type:complete
MKRNQEEKDEIVQEARERFDNASEGWGDIYEQSLSDISFIDDDEGQWEDSVRESRHNRPCLTFDKLSASVDRVVGGQMAQMPSVKVRAAEEGDEDIAEVYQGLIRQIDQRGIQAFKTAFKFAVKSGWGCLMVDHNYIDDVSLDQDIILREIKNPFSVLLDPIIQAQHVQEARFGFMFEDLERKEFERLYPEAKSYSGEGDFETRGNLDTWVTDDYVRVADYFRVVLEESTLVQLSDGRVVDLKEVQPVRDELNLQGITLGKTRKVQRRKVERFKITGMEVLEEVECVGRFIPIVPMFGKTSNINGKYITRGIVRKAKDAQRLYNYSRSVAVEVTALTPKQPYFVTPAMIKGHESKWKNMMVSNDPVLQFNFDQGQKPYRETPAQGSPGLLQDAQFAAEDIKATTGIFDANIGQQGQETSGVAIGRRQFQGEMSNFEYQDQLIDSMELAGRIMIDMIPAVYDTERTIRIIGEDEREETVQVNKTLMDAQTGTFVKTMDLNVGNYDIKIASGPSFTTRKQETAEQLSSMISQNPAMSQLVGDILFQNLDLVGGDEAIKRLRSAGVKAGIIEPNQEEAVALQSQIQASKQLEQQAAQLELALKQAEVATERAEAIERESKASMNTVKTAVEQMKLAEAQEDLESKQIAQMRLRQSVGLPVI